MKKNKFIQSMGKGPQFSLPSLNLSSHSFSQLSFYDGIHEGSLKNIASNYVWRFDHAYDPDSLYQEEKWHVLVEKIMIDFSKENDQLPALELPNSSYKQVFDDFVQAIVDYQSDQKIYDHVKSISERSAKNFLFLIPVLSRHSPKVAVDADTGYLCTTFEAHDHSLMSALISDKGEIHFSMAGQGEKVFKITGTAKLKTSRDLKKFDKVLSML